MKRGMENCSSESIMLLLGILMFTHIPGVKTLFKESEFSWTSITLYSLICILGPSHSLSALIFTLLYHATGKPEAINF